MKKQEIIVKVTDILNQMGSAELESFYEWLEENRDSDYLPWNS
jgi:hypothetical protein